MKTTKSSPGFTIVELLIVVVIIAILAAITIVSYNGISNRAKQSAAQSAASQGGKKVFTYATTNSDQYPADLTTAGITTTTATVYEYSVDNNATPKTFCLTATTANVSYYVSNSISTPTSGTCPGHTGNGEGGGGGPIADGSPIQTITDANCPATRTRAVDARDNHTYWVQKLADNKCWMLTNLAYAGDGTNTYGDMKTLTNGTGGSMTYTVASYYVVPSTTNFTTEPTNPSTSTDGTGQYGYLYNWCAAKGVQTSTSACANASTPTPDANISLCPAGWRLPVGNGGDFSALNTAINSGSTSTDAGLRTAWLAQRSGSWNSGFSYQGSNGYYWSASQTSATYAYNLYFNSSSVYTVDYYNKNYGFAVRCIAT